ncbi:MAG TPA: acyl carrier protein [Nitriliruptorales bacterium]
MDTQHLYDRLTSILVETFGVPAEDLSRDATWWSLDLDSLDVVELMLVVEQELGVKVADEQLEGINTVGQAVDVIAAAGVAA